MGGHEVRRSSAHTASPQIALGEGRSSLAAQTRLEKKKAMPGWPGLPYYYYYYFRRTCESALE